MHEPGERIGPYEIVSSIGYGGMAEVYRATDHKLDREVALKLLAREISEDATFRARFVREYRLAAALRHQNIVPIYDAGDWEGQLYIAMPIVGDATLAELIKREGTLPLDRTVAITNQVAAALDVAHAEGLVHRDIKPANLLIEQHGQPPRDHVYIVDFGLTLSVDATSRMTRTGAYMGTLAYMAPELLLARGIDGRADQYALACTVYQALSGTPPFVRDNEAALITAHMYDSPPSLVAIRPDLPRAVGDVLARALSKEPADRYPSAVAFANALAAAAAGKLVENHPTAQPTVRAAALPSRPPMEHEGVTRRVRPDAAPPRRRSGAAILAGILVAAAALAVLAYGVVVFLGGAPGPSGSNQTDGGIAGVSPSPGLSPNAPVASASPGATVPTLPITWAVAISATNYQPQAGQRVTVTATSNVDVAVAGVAIQIIDSSTGNVTKTCTSGQSCAQAERLGGPGSRSYAARVSSVDGSVIYAQSAAIVVTWSPAPPTPTPPPPTPDSSLPVVQSGSWNVAYNLISTDGNPPVDLGNHERRYEITPDCPGIDNCRIRASTFETDGTPVGRISFTWRGDAFEYRGSANYYRVDGGSTCTSGAGDPIEDAYTTSELVRLRPERYRDGLVVELVGTKTISGTPTTTGAAAGCEPYELTYSAQLTV